MEPDAPLLILTKLNGNDPIALSSLQEFLSSHLSSIECLWWVIWIGMFVRVFSLAVSKFGRERREKMD